MSDTCVEKPLTRDVNESRDCEPCYFVLPEKEFLTDTTSNSAINMAHS